MTKERIAGVNPEEIGTPKGSYRVELVDRHTGRVTERVESSNYLSPALTRQLAWTQGVAFHHGYRFIHKGDASGVWPHTGAFASAYASSTGSALGVEDLSHPPAFPVDNIIGTNATHAEVTTDEWIRGEVLGWGSRWKSANVPAAGRRGQINEAQCEITLDGVKLVWDFNEDQGNGTIESMHIGRMGKTGGAAQLLVPSSASGHFGLPPGQTTTDVFDPIQMDSDGANDTANVTYASFVCWNDDGAFFVDGNTDRIVWYDPADYTTDASGRTLPAAYKWGSAVLASFPAYTTGASAGPGFYNANSLIQGWVDRLAERAYLVWTDGHDSVQIGIWNTTSGALIDAREVIDSGDSLENNNILPRGVTMIGTDLYFALEDTTSTQHDGKIYRYDTGTFTLSASITMPNDATGTPLTYYGTVGPMVATDGTDLLVDTAQLGIVKISTAGALVAIVGDPRVQDDDTAVVPWYTGNNVQSTFRMGFGRDPMQRQFGTSGNLDRTLGLDNTTSNLYAFVLPDLYYTEAPFGVFVVGGKLYACSTFGNSVTSGSFTPIPITGAGNLFSRSLLDTAIVKTNSSTMKWTYELTLPSEWRSTVPHTALF